MRRDNLVGLRFHELTVLAPAGSDSRGKSRWLCRCDCGNETVVLGYNLKAGATKTCGCARNRGRVEIGPRRRMQRYGTGAYAMDPERYREALAGAEAGT